MIIESYRVEGVPGLWEHRSLGKRSVETIPLGDRTLSEFRNILRPLSERLQSENCINNSITEVP